MVIMKTEAIGDQITIEQDRGDLDLLRTLDQAIWLA
jgi:hypothetical protein